VSLAGADLPPRKAGPNSELVLADGQAPDSETRRIVETAFPKGVRSLPIILMWPPVTTRQLMNAFQVRFPKLHNGYVM